MFLDKVLCTIAVCDEIYVSYQVELDEISSTNLKVLSGCPHKRLESLIARKQVVEYILEVIQLFKVFV